GLVTHPAPVDASGYTVDLDALDRLAWDVRPKLITIGGSLNLFPHPVAAIRAIADDVGAKVLFDAAHLCGMVAGEAWPDPLAQGAHLMTMSTYKSLGGPAGGLVVTNDADLAEKLDAIAFPGMTANFDAAKSAALAITLLDWREFGPTYAEAMVATAKALASALDAEGVPLFAKGQGFTTSHQFAVLAAPYGGGQTVAMKLRRAGFLACGIGLPAEPVAGDLNGLRIGTPELVRRGMTVADMPRLGKLIARALAANDPDAMAAEVGDWRETFGGLSFIRP
ncbi:MAG: beta-eliminating lyase-related protein, partial [Rhodospirillales bacterium]